MTKETVQKNCVWEFCFRSTEKYTDPYNEVTLDIIFSSPNQGRLRVPAFWAGYNKWVVRFSADQIGEYNFETICSNPDDRGLHDQTGTISVSDYRGSNPLLQHGRLRVAENKHHFVHADGTPFFWIGDTWWMGVTDRLKYPKDFKKLTADRVKKGFNLIQMVAGLQPDMDIGDERGKNKAGFSFAKDFARINPKFYEHVDQKIQHLVDSGLVPCIFGSWGYYLPKLGVEKIELYWRCLVARYGAYPIVWCIAGEATMPFYTSKTRKEDEESQKKGWCEVATYVREIDPFDNLLSVHPDIQGSGSANARDFSSGPGLFDFEMLQTGHHGFDALPNTEQEVVRAIARKPQMPVVNAEVNYEGICGQSWQDVQRLSFYISIFNGAVGYTYGANGLWQFNEKNKPYGQSVSGITWGNMPWEEAAELPGGQQVALGAQLLQQFKWWEFALHPEWIDPQNEKIGWRKVLCMGIERQIRLVYVPQLWIPPVVKDIEQNVSYKAYYFDPCTGNKYLLGEVEAKDGNWQPPPPPEIHDWLIVLESTHIGLT